MKKLLTLFIVIFPLLMYAQNFNVLRLDQNGSKMFYTNNNRNFVADAAGSFFVSFTPNVIYLQQRQTAGWTLQMDIERPVPVTVYEGAKLLVKFSNGQIITLSNIHAGKDQVGRGSYDPILGYRLYKVTTLFCLTEEERLLLASKYITKIRFDIAGEYIDLKEKADSFSSMIRDLFYKTANTVSSKVDPIMEGF